MMRESVDGWIEWLTTTKMTIVSLITTCGAGMFVDINWAAILTGSVSFLIGISHLVRAYTDFKKHRRDEINFRRRVDDEDDKE